MVSRLFQKRIDVILSRLKGKNIIFYTTSANFFGRESLGRRQIRGNGVLALTNDMLYFEMWKPKKQLQIFLSSIEGIETPKSHLGKTKFKPLLKIVFRNEKEELDSAAWFVRDLQKWKEIIQKLIGN